MTDMTITTFNRIFDVPEPVKPYIDLIVTPQEKELVNRLGQEQESRSPTEIAALLGIPADQAWELVQSAYHRAVINKSKEDAARYVAGTLYDRLGYFTQYEQESWQTIPQDDRVIIDEWYIDEFTDRIRLQIEKERDAFYRDDVLPIREALETVERIEKELGKPYYVVPCNCRTTTNGCRFSVDACVSNHYGSNSQWDRGYGRQVTIEEVKRLMTALDKEGLMHTVSPTGHICNCETCCCYEFRAALKLDSKGLYPRAPYRAQWDEEKCIHCGICAKRCHFKAFGKTAGTRRITFDVEKCWGCGICECTCPQDAIRMVKL